MNLKDYERVKFALAEILRGAALRARRDGRDRSAAFRDLFARLAEDRFNVVVAGRFNRGKTSLMNALLGTTRLPVGILPLTSVITTVSYGSVELATIEYEGRSLHRRVRIEDLAEYVTERGNPGNVHRVKTARIELPAPLLRRGFHFIDTPGIGSAIAENTQTTHQFLPEADAVVLVTSYDSPLSEDELRVIDAMRRFGRRLFFVVNKSDLVTPEARARVLEHVRRSLYAAGVANPGIYSVSALTPGGDEMTEFAGSLTRFLVEEKQREFLRVMFDRIRDAIEGEPGNDAELRALRDLAAAVGSRGPEQRAADVPEEEERFSSCRICVHAADAVISFLSSFQFDLIASEEKRERLAEAGGFCPAHAWQYEALAGPRGACIALTPLLESTAARLRDVADETPRVLGELVSSLRAGTEACPACRVRRSAERTAVDAAVGVIDAGGPPDAYCLAHFGTVIADLRDEDAARGLVAAQAAAFQRVAEDMQRYVVKFDATRQYLMADEERAADQRGVTLLAGSRGYNGIASAR